MGFVDNLYSDATGGGGAGIYSSGDNSDLLRRKPIEEAGNQLLPFYYSKLAAERSDPYIQAQQRDSLGLNSGRLRSTMSPDQMNTVYKPETEAQPQITPYQNEQINLKKSKQAQDAKTGNEKLALDQSKHELDVQKNSQINAAETKKLQDNLDLANRRLQLAQEAQAGKEYDAARISQIKQAQIDAAEAQHKLDNARRDATEADTKSLHEANIAKLNAEIDALKGSTTTTEVNDAGTTRTTTKTTGSPNSSPKGKKVTAPDGKTGTWNTDNPLPTGYSLAEK